MGAYQPYKEHIVEQSTSILPPSAKSALIKVGYERSPDLSNKLKLYIALTFNSKVLLKV